MRADFYRPERRAAVDHGVAVAALRRAQVPTAARRPVPVVRPVGRGAGRALLAGRGLDQRAQPGLARLAHPHGPALRPRHHVLRPAHPRALLPRQVRHLGTLHSHSDLFPFLLESLDLGTGSLILLRFLGIVNRQYDRVDKELSNGNVARKADFFELRDELSFRAMERFQSLQVFSGSHLTVADEPAGLDHTAQASRNVSSFKLSQYGKFVLTDVLETAMNGMERQSPGPSWN